MDKNSSFLERSEVVTTYNSLNKLNKNVLSLGILSTAVIALAFSPIFTKFAEIELSPTSIIFNRLWIATAIVAGWRSLHSPQIEPVETRPESRQLILLVAASLCATASALLWAISFNHTSVASSTVLRSLTPLFISLGAWLILKQNFEGKFVVGMTLSIVGATAIGWDDLQLGTDLLIGDGIALLSAALHGANLLIIGYLRDRGCTTDKVLFWRCGCGALTILPLIYFTGDRLLPTSISAWLSIVALAVVCQTFGQGLLVYSLKQFSSSFVGVFTLLKPLITALLAWAIFSEEISLINGVALILILTGIYLANKSNSAVTG